MTNPLFSATILTIFPELFPGPLSASLAGKALEKGIWNLNIRNLRDFTADKHQSVDDRPFGGGAGMVMRPDVLDNALRSESSKNTSEFSTLNSKLSKKLLYMSPRGALLTQERIKTLVNHKNLVILCGRFEGVDERVLEEYNIEEVSIGDYVLSGGELAAMVLLDACVRLLPGVVGEIETLEEESFGDAEGYASLLEYPHYTRPAEWKGRKVPEVLLSGNHAEINRWRHEQAKRITQERRPDLWKKAKVEN